MNKEYVQKLIDEAVAINPKLFLIDAAISSTNKIKIIVDGDAGIPLSECVRISRHVEHNLDQEEDFSLEVTSPDISQPLQVKRQYTKNIGRIVQVKTDEEELEGKVTAVTEHEITLQWKTREPKPIGKGKHTVEKIKTIPFINIKEAKVKILF